MAPNNNSNGTRGTSGSSGSTGTSPDGRTSTGTGDTSGRTSGGGARAGTTVTPATSTQRRQRSPAQSSSSSSPARNRRRGGAAPDGACDAAEEDPLLELQSPRGGRGGRGGRAATSTARRSTSTGASGRRQQANARTAGRQQRQPPPPQPPEQGQVPPPPPPPDAEEEEYLQEARAALAAEAAEEGYIRILERAELEADYGDSDDEGDEGEIHAESLREVMEERLAEINIMQHQEDAEATEALDSTININNFNNNNRSNAELVIEACEAAGVKIPWPEDAWTVPEPKIQRGEPPNWTDVPNPGVWPPCCYKAVFEKSGDKRYKYHALPTGATPVVNQEEVGDWRFHYAGEFQQSDYAEHFPEPFRSGATASNMFPESRRGCLSREKLEMNGLTKERMQNDDFLFFLNLVLPISDCKPEHTFPGDNRMSFYETVLEFSEIYRTMNGGASSYGHVVKPFTVDELVRWDHIVWRDGACGGSKGNIKRRWDAKSPACDKEIMNAMSYSRFLEIKRFMKLCNNLLAAKPGQPGYDPAYKFDYIMKVLVHNTNEMTEKAELDVTGDETTWPFGGYGEPGAGLVERIPNKPGVTRGGQMVLASDVHRRRLRAYKHRHKKYPGEINDWGNQGAREVRMLCEDLEKLVGEGKIFPFKPHLCFDNFFSGDIILDWAGMKGWPLLMTGRRDRLPKDIPSKYLHKEKTTSTKVSRSARWTEPILAVKVVEPTAGPDGTVVGQKYMRQHCSMQSTSSTNFVAVNSQNSCKFSARMKKRGQGTNERKWAVEMNEFRHFYLGSYGTIDGWDHLLKNMRCQIISRRYWIAAMIHIKCLAVITAYDMYKEVCEGNINPDWKVENPKSFEEFRMTGTKQGLAYSGSKNLYKGDAAKRVNTQQSYNRRQRLRRQQDCVTAEQLKQAKQGGVHSRLCGDLSQFLAHAQSYVTCKSEHVCVVCGLLCFNYCALCGKYMHKHTKRGNGTQHCDIEWHNDAFFGLAKKDHMELLKKSRNTWKEPTKNDRLDNAEHIKDLKLGARNALTET